MMKKPVQNKLLIITFLFVTLQMTGCAYVTRRITLQYNSSMYPPIASGSPTIHISNLNDRRADSSSLGCVRNGWGIKTARVEEKSGEPAVTTWISMVLANELKRAECSILSGDSKGKNQAQFTIGGDLQRIYVDSCMKLQGEIIMTICVRNGEQTILNKIYHAEATKVNWWGSAKEFQLTLDMTMQDLMKKMVPDIIGATAVVAVQSPPPVENTSTIPAIYEVSDFRIVEYNFNANTSEGTVTVDIGGKGFQARLWVVKNIGMICSGKNVALNAGSENFNGAKYTILDESIKDGLLKIVFHAVY